ncbi:MAG: PP2C family protein-serine/threonine phosphatase [Bacteroidota bacterium]
MKILVAILAFTLLLEFIPDPINNEGIPSDFFMLIIAEIIPLTGIVICFLIGSYLFKWLNIHRHKKTRTYIEISGFILLYAFTYEYLSSFFTFLEHDIILFIHGVILVTGIITVFLNARRNSWIAVLPRPNKLKLMSLSAVNVVISTVLAVTVGSQGWLNETYYLLLPGIDAVVFLTFSYFSAYSLRIFLASMASLPTSEIVERRTSELSSLTYLNKVVAETVDLEVLLDTVTELALRSSGAHSAWCEIYENDSIKIRSSRNIDDNLLYSLHQDYRLKNNFKMNANPLLIDSIIENRDIFFIKQFMPQSNTLIAVPLYEGALRVGTLVVINHEEYSFEQDDLKVLSAFSDNVSIALENARLLKDSIEKEKYRSELSLARRIQKNLLPDKLPQFDNYSVDAISIPADEIGGDYYDIVTLADGRQCLLIADVSGKGISAAIIMAQLKGVVMSIASSSKGAAELLRKINRTLYGTMDKQMYITMSALVFENEPGRLTFARAGHMPIIYNRNSEAVSNTPKGIGIGLTGPELFDKNLEEIEIPLDEGSSCLLFTDGINELRNVHNEEFGYSPIKSFLKGNKYYDAGVLNHKIISELREFADSNTQHDDITIVSVVRKK